MESVIFCSRAIATALFETVSDILGEQVACTVICNTDDNFERMQVELMNAVRDAGDAGLVIFTDIKGGSCWNLALVNVHQLKDVTLMAGVNIPMLIKFFTWHNRVPASELLARVCAAGKEGVECRSMGDV